MALKELLSDSVALLSVAAEASTGTHINAAKIMQKVFINTSLAFQLSSDSTKKLFDTKMQKN
jgi:hypothetical protein